MAWNNAQKFIIRYMDDPNCDIYILSSILSKDSINLGCVDGRPSIVHLAATGSSIRIMRLLVEYHFAPVNVADKEGATPLHWTCQKGNIEMIEYLIKRKANLNAIDYYGWSALHYCVQGGHLDAIKLLIEKYGMYIELETADKQTVLSIACEEEEKHIIKYLCKLNADIKISLNTAVKCNQPKIVHYLTKYGNLSKEMYQQTTNPLHKSIIYNRTNITKILLKNVPWMMNLPDPTGLYPKDYINVSSRKTLISLIQEYSKQQDCETKINIKDSTNSKFRTLIQKNFQSAKRATSFPLKKTFIV